MTRPTWNDWLKENKSSLTFEEGHLQVIYNPNWNPSVVKSSNQYDFSGTKLKNVNIINAQAELINFRNSVFENVLFEDGDFSTADFSNCSFINTTFRKSIITNAHFDGATFVNCNLNRVNLSGAKFNVKEIKETVIYGISAWDIEISEESIQSKLIIENTDRLYSNFLDEGHIPMMVENIELAQFIYYLTNHKKMRDTINILNDKGVLLLGKFKNGGLERLYKMRDWFSEQNYLPMIFDFERPANLKRIETIITLSGLSKVVVADLSGDSVSVELQAILNNFKKKPVIVYHDQTPFSLIKDFIGDHEYFDVIKYDGSEEHLYSQLPKKLANAEANFKKIILDLANKYD